MVTGDYIVAVLFEARLVDGSMSVHVMLTSHEWCVCVCVRARAYACVRVCVGDSQGY